MHFKRSKYFITLILVLNIAGGVLAKHDKMSMKEASINIMTTKNSTMEMDDQESTTKSREETTEKHSENSDVEEESTKKSVKNFTCQVTGALISMSNSIKELDNDIKAIKNQMFEKCPGFHISANDTDLPKDVDAPAGVHNGTDDKTEVEDESHTDEESMATPFPPIPTECDEPFQPVASSCYYFLYYPHDWKTWGDASAYCQTFGGTLAAPHRVKDLQTYLVENFSNVFWVGAKQSTTKKNTFEWLNGKELSPEDWKEGQPSKSAAKFCVYLEFFSGYKAINHYCGEKFSFICEKRNEME